MNSIAITCGVLGCAGWIATWLLLQPADQGEKLARSITSIFNTIVMGAVGGPSVLCSVAGFVVARKSSRRSNHPRAKIGYGLAMLGFALAVLVLGSRSRELWMVVTDSF